MDYRSRQECIQRGKDVQRQSILHQVVHSRWTSHATKRMSTQGYGSSSKLWMSRYRSSYSQSSRITGLSTEPCTFSGTTLLFNWNTKYQGLNKQQTLEKAKIYIKLKHEWTKHIHQSKILHIRFVSTTDSLVVGGRPVSCLGEWWCECRWIHSGKRYGYLFDSES